MASWQTTALPWRRGSFKESYDWGEDGCVVVRREDGTPETFEEHLLSF